MAVSDELAEEFQSAWVSFYNLEQEMLETQRTVRHYEGEHGRVDPADPDYADDFGDYSQAFEEAEWRIERLLDEAEQFYGTVAELVVGLGRNHSALLPEYFPDPGEVTDFDVESIDERPPRKYVKGFGYNPGSENYSTSELAHGTLALVHRWQNMKSEVSEYVDPMLEEVDDVVEDEVPRLEEELEDIESEALEVKQAV